MSLACLTWVWKHSEAKLGARLVLLALADYAHDDGTRAFPSVEMLAEKSRMSVRGVRDALRKLEAGDYIEKMGTSGYGTSIWRIVGAADSAEIGKLTHDPGSKLPPTRQPVTSKGEASDEAKRLCRLLADRIRQRDPKAKVAPDGQGWQTDMDRLLRLDGREPAEVERVIDWCQSHDFWQGNILSAGKLRAKFTQLVAQSANGNGKSAKDYSAYDRWEKDYSDG